MLRELHSNLECYSQKYADYFGRNKIDSAERCMKPYVNAKNSAGSELSAALETLGGIKIRAKDVEEDRKRQKELELEFERGDRTVILTTTNDIEATR